MLDIIRVVVVVIQDYHPGLPPRYYYYYYHPSFPSHYYYYYHHPGFPPHQHYYYYSIFLTFLLLYGMLNINNIN